MPDEIAPTKPKTKSIVTPDEDLSAEIARTVTKMPSESVTCRRITRDHYRCNWWAPENTLGYDNPRMTGLLVTTNRVAKSRFLRATRIAGGLEITIISSERPVVDD